MKRILHIVGGMDRAGAETMIMNLYRCIDRDKFQFDFLYFTNKGCDFDEEIKQLGGKIYRITATNPLKRMKATQDLLQSNPQWKTVHCHMLFSNAFRLYAGYKAGVKQRISHSHNTSDESRNKLVSKIYQGLSRKFQLKYATDFVACGVEAGKFLFPTIKEVPVIPNSVDVQQFADKAAQSKNHLKNEFSLAEDTLILLQLGRLSQQKNHDFSIEIAKALKDQKINFNLFFAGEGNLEEDIKTKVKAAGLNEQIKFLGLRTDIAELLGGSDLLLMPSLHEGFPVVLVESQAAGTPALIADTISSEVDLGVNLITFESLTASAKIWAEQISKSIVQGKSATKTRIDILKHEGFDIFANVKRLEKLYTQTK